MEPERILQWAAEHSLVVRGDVERLLGIPARDAETLLRLLLKAGHLVAFSSKGIGRYYVLSASEASRRNLPSRIGKLPLSHLRKTVAGGIATGASSDTNDLIRALSHALRHAPREYGIELETGWANIDALLNGLSAKIKRWRFLSRAELEKVVSDGHRRFEIDGDRIRALYGHSLQRALTRGPKPPPSALYHATDATSARRIVGIGLLPMRRTHVHLSADAGYAAQARRVKDLPFVLFAVRTRRAHESGVQFYEATRVVWLSTAIAPEFLDVVVGRSAMTDG